MTFGLSAGAVAMAAVAAGTAMYSANQANKAGAAQVYAANNESYKGYIASVNNTMENNRAIGEANITNTIRTGYKVGLLNLQTARLKELAAKEGWDTSRKASEALGAADASAAASGTVGSSVDAVSLDIRKKSAEAQIAVDQNFTDALENQNFKLSATTEAGLDAMRSLEAVNDINGINTRTFTGSSVLAAGIIGGASSLVGSYASSQMSLGLPKSKEAVWHK